MSGRVGPAARRRWLLGVVLTVLPAGCGRPAPDVVLYVSADDHVARQVVQAFEQHTGLRVASVGDAEQSKTTGLANRLRSEADHPQADVFWSSEIFNTINLAAEGVLDEYASPAAADWPARFRDPQHRWYGFAARARVIVFAPDRVAPEDRPRTWMDLTQPRYKGRIVMADPRFGTTGGHLAAMEAFWTRLVGPAYYEAFLMGLAANEVRLLPSGNAGVLQAVADGEADLGLTDTDDVWAARARGLDVDLVYPRHDADAPDSGGGTLLIPNTVARVRGAPHPEAAARLIDFLLSEEVERMLAESVSHNVPIRPGLADDYPRYAVPDPLRVDYRRAAAGLQGAVEQAMTRLGRGGDAR
jgi:iron(III) transport system substrate-binding protein